MVMQDRLVCECGSDRFLYFGDLVRCHDCCTDYRQTKSEPFPGGKLVMTLWKKQRRNVEWEKVG